MRYTLSRQLGDLKELLLGLYLPLPRGSIHPPPPNLVQIFCYLTLAIFSLQKNLGGLDM